jgi:hypothetical protein
MKRTDTQTYSVPQEDTTHDGFKCGCCGKDNFFHLSGRRLFALGLWPLRCAGCHSLTVSTIFPRLKVYMRGER